LKLTARLGGQDISMSNEDDGRHRSPLGAEFHDSDGSRPGFRDVEQPPARWATLQSALGPEDVRRRLSENLRKAARGHFTVTETRFGVLIRWARGKKVIGAEVTLTGWESGTQIHLAVPSAVRATDKDIESLLRHIRSAIE